VGRFNSNNPSNPFQLKALAPELRIQVLYHQLTNSYALYLTTSYVQMLKGAELCRLKKRLKACFGGALKEFSFDEAQEFRGVEDRQRFLTGAERTMVLKQRLDMIRAPRSGLSLGGGAGEDGTRIEEGEVVVEKLKEMGVVDQLLPLHETGKLKELQAKWVYTLFDEQPLEEIKVGDDSYIARGS